MSFPLVNVLWEIEINKGTSQNEMNRNKRSPKKKSYRKLNTNKCSGVLNGLIGLALT